MNRFSLLRRFLLFLCCLPAFLWAQPTIHSLRFDGLTKTNPYYLEQFVVSAPGAPLDTLVIAEDIQRLRNLRIFYDVRSRVEVAGNKATVVFECSELLTLLPIINFGGINENFWYQLGLTEHNWMGRGHTIGGFYRYYDRHSFAIYTHLPYLVKQRWGLIADITHNATVEPLQFGADFINVNVDRNAYLGFIQFNPTMEMAFSFGGGYLLETYRQRESTDRFPDSLDFKKYLIKVGFDQQTLDYHLHYLSGFSNQLIVESVLTEGDPTTFWKVLNISRFYARPWPTGNLAFRLRTGISTNKVSPFVPFVIDSYLNVRGSGNRISRGTAELTLNSEYRQTFMQNHIGAIQGVAFLDLSAWRPAGSTVKEMWKAENNVSFTGAGLRIHLRKLNNFVFRLDYGFSLTTEGQRGVVFGAGQYF